MDFKRIQKIALLDSGGHTDAAMKALGGCPEEVLWVTASERISSLLKDRGAAQVLELSFRTGSAEIDRMDRIAWNVARNWHRHMGCAPYLRYEGFDLGELTELYWGLFLFWALNLMQGDRELPQLPAVPWYSFVDNSESAGQAASGMLPSQEEYFSGKWAKHRGVNLSVIQVPNLTRSRPPAVVFREAVRDALRAGLDPVRMLARPGSSAKGVPSVLIASAPQHIASVLPHLSGLPVDYLDESFRLAKWPLLIRNGVRYRSYPDVRKAFLNRKAQERLRDYRALLASGGESLSAAFYDAMNECAPPAVLRCWIEDRRRYFMEVMLPEAAEYVETFREFFKDRKQTAVLVDEDTVLFRKALVRVARANGCPTFQVPHTVFLTDTHYDLFPVSSEKVLLGGLDVAEFYRSHEVESSAIEVIGIPRYDRLREVLSPEARGRIRSKLNLDPNCSHALLAMTTTHPSDPRRKRSELKQALQDTVGMFSKTKGWRLWIKPHPLDFDFDLRQECGEFDNQVCGVVRSGDAVDWIAACDAVISYPSNMVIEAFASGRPSIILDYFPMSVCHVPFWGDQMMRFRATDAASLERIWSGLFLEDSVRSGALLQKTLEARWTGPLDGASGKRAALCIRGATA